MEKLIKSFLSTGYCNGDGDGNGDGNGYGYGDGYGNGYGDGDGNGYGYGDGDGDGDGNGYGYGDGYGNGYGDGDGNGYGYGDGDGNGYGYGIGDGNGYGDLSSVKKVCDDTVYMVDGVPTTFDNIKGNIAKCRILQADMTWEHCFVVRIGDSFAHGETIHDAQRDAMQKHMSDAPGEERIKKFTDAFPELDTIITAKELFIWHNTLTGSCLMGRTQWCKDHGINVDTDTFTVREFIKLTQNSYGGETIKKLKQFYNNN